MRARVVVKCVWLGSLLGERSLIMVHEVGGVLVHEVDGVLVHEVDGVLVHEVGGVLMYEVGGIVVMVECWCMKRVGS
jgi:hypothetical protein